MKINHEQQYEQFLKEEKNLTHMVNNRVKKYGNKVALKDRAAGHWRSMTWNELGDTVRKFIKGPS